MKILALLSWFDEPPEFLARAVKTAGASGVDTIVAVDGAYALLPGARPASDPKQGKAVLAAARAAGVDLVLRVPSRVWENEIEKRNALFDMALALAEPGVDWFFVIDADYEIKADGLALKAALAATEHDVAVVHAYTPEGPNGQVTFGPPERMEFRALFRAQKIRLQKNHWTYFGEDGGKLWGLGLDELVPACDVSKIVSVTHWTYYRPKARNARQYDYYRARDKTNIERGPCHNCGEEATASVPWFERDKDDPDSVWAALVEVCDDCHADVIKEGLRRAEEWNVEEMVRAGGA